MTAMTELSEEADVGLTDSKLELEEGNQDGERDGQQDGERDGQQDGERDGHQHGERDGQQHGERDGHQHGERDGQQHGERDGQQDGERDGQQDGERDGQQDGERDGHQDGEMVSSPVAESTSSEQVVCVNQNWRAGSQCRAMYSEDGLVYPAVVLWVKGQRCRVRFNDYNNEEEQDISSLLSLDELHGPSKATAAKLRRTSVLFI